MSSPTYPPPVASPEFRISDFWLATAAGLLAVPVALLVGFARLDTGWQLAILAIAQYAGHWVGIRFVLRRRQVTLRDLGFDLVPSDLAYVVLGSLLQVILAIVFVPLQQLLGLETSAQAIESALLNVEGTGQRFLLAVAIALLAPTTEEMLFRGILWKAFSSRVATPLVGTSVIFALFHMTGLDRSQFLKAAALALPQLFLVGLVLGRLRRQSGRLGPSIFTHAGYNLVAVLVLLGFFGDPTAGLPQ